jgi:NAD+ synthase
LDVKFLSNNENIKNMPFTKDVLKINAEKVITEITFAIKHQVVDVLHRRGAVVGLSGGIDSSVCTALCTRALGKDNVFVIFMPERVSSPESLSLGQMLTNQLGVKTTIENLSSALEGAGCYTRQLEAIREVFPQYADGWKSKVTIPSILQGDRLNVLRLTVESPNGEQSSARMPLAAYLKLIAATNWKQRIRKSMEYYHADRLNYAVCGTPNRLEYDQGFFVKNGDGSADFKPIAHLYKTQVYEIAQALGIPEEITSRPPTTDTYSLAQTQEEFYFALPYDKMDLCLYAHNNNIPAGEVASTVGLSAEQVERVFKDIESKRRGTHYLHMPPMLVEPVTEIRKD